MAGQDRHTGEGKRETWEAWQAPGAPPPRLLTRAELLALAERVGLAVDERTLRYWESLGLLPGPVRRRHQGATRAIYPAWQLPLIFLVRLSQAMGETLDQIAPHLRAEAQHLSRLFPAGAPPSASTPDDLREWLNQVGVAWRFTANIAVANQVVATPEWFGLLDAIRAARIAFQDRHGVRLGPVEFCLSDNFGREERHAL